MVKPTELSSSLPVWSEAQCKLFPLVRAVSTTGVLGTLDRVTAVYPDQIIRGWTRRLESLHFKVDDPIQFSKNLREAKGFSFEETTWVRLFPGGRLTKQAVLRLRGSDRADFLLPHDQTTHVAAFLSHKLGDRFQVQSKPLFHGGWLLSLPIFLWLIGFALSYLSTLLPPELLPPEWSIGWPVFAGVAGTITFMVLAYVFFDHLPTKHPWMVVEQDIEVVNRSSAVKPGSTLQSEFAPATVYVRSPFDSRAHSLASPNRWAYGAGVRSPATLPNPWRFMGWFNPFRLLRVLFAFGADTCEAQLRAYFQRFGSFAVVDEPVENVSSQAAADDDSSEVVRLVGQAQTVILQPTLKGMLSKSIENALRELDKPKILLCLVEFHRRQNEYETFRLQVEQRLSMPLPNLGGLTSTPAFLFFDSERQACLRSTCYVNPFLWPTTGNPIDLQSTLKNFLKPLPERRIDTKSGIIPTGYSYGLNFSAAAVWLGLGTVVFTTACLSLGTVVIAFATAPKRSVNYESRVLVQKSEPDEITNGSSQRIEDGSDLNTAATNRSEQASRVQTLIDMADSAFGKRDIDLMDEFVNAALETAPDSPTALFYHAIVLRERAEPEKAIATMEQVVKLAPEVAANWSYLGLLNLQLKRYEATVEACNKALEIDPDLANVQLNRGQARLELQEPESAFADAERALKLDKVDRKAALKLAGLSLVRLERPMEALPYFKERTLVDSKDPDVFRELGELLDTLGSRKLPEGNASTLAREAYDRAMQLAPPSSDIRFRRALALAREGKYAESLKDFQSILPGNEKNSQVLSEYAGIQRLVGHYQLASEYFEKALAVASKKEPVLNGYTVVLVAQGRWEEALKSCRAAKGSTAVLPISYLQETLLLNELNRDVEAARLRREGLPKLFDKENLGTVLLCLMWTLHGEKDEGLLQSALAWVEKADESIQSHRIVDILRAAMMERVGRSSEARSIIDAVDERGLTPAQLALSRLVKASIAGSLDDKSVAAEHLAFASQWFQSECPASFAEGRPETFPTDWVLRAAFRRVFLSFERALREKGVSASLP